MGGGVQLSVITCLVQCSAVLSSFHLIDAARVLVEPEGLVGGRSRFAGPFFAFSQVQSFTYLRFQLLDNLGFASHSCRGKVALFGWRLTLNTARRLLFALFPVFSRFESVIAVFVIFGEA